MSNTSQNFIPDKPFKSFEEQITIMESRNITVPQHQYAIDMLSSYSYTTLINGYKDAFLVPNHDDLFIDGTNFNDLVDLHFFDNDLNNIILKYVIYIENILKTRISYLVANKYGVYTDINDKTCSNPNDYLCKKNYSNSTGMRESTLRYIKKISVAHANLLMKHYLHTKNHIPPWVIATSIPYRTAIDWYSILKDADKSEICNQFIKSDTLSQEQKKEFLIKALNILHQYRNTIAHGSQTRFVSQDPHVNQLPKDQSLCLFGNGLTEKEYDSGIGHNDLLAVFSIILILLSDEKVEYNFFTDIDLLIGTHFDAHYCTRHLNSIYNFPEDIRNRLTWVWENKRGTIIHKYFSSGLEISDMYSDSSLISEAAATSEIITETNDNKNSTKTYPEFVWISIGGKKYHRVGHCQYIHNSCSAQVPLGSAIILGYNRCSHCYNSKCDFD